MQPGTGSPERGWRLAGGRIQLPDQSISPSLTFLPGMPAFPKSLVTSIPYQVLLYRHAGKDKFRWNTVPLPLMELIIEKLDGFSGNGSLASMRLVSKSWLAAVTAYPGLLSDVEVEKASDMKNLRKIMPNVVGLELSCNNKINLQPLSALSKLTYLSLAGQYPSREDEGELQANLSVLPKSLDTLRLKSVYVLPKCLTRLKCVDLRSLVFCFGRNKTAEVLELLQCFPQLEVHPHIPTLGGNCLHTLQTN